MLKEQDRFFTMRSMREYLDGFQDGSGWTEVDEMLCLAADCLSHCSERDTERHSPILPTTLERCQQVTHHILVIRTVIKYIITHTFFLKDDSNRCLSNVIAPK